MSKRFRIRCDRTKRVRAVVEAETHQQAGHVAANLLHGKQWALRMTTFNGRDGVFAALNDRTGAEEERFFVEAEDGSGKLSKMPSNPPSMTNEDAKKLLTMNSAPSAASNGSSTKQTNGKGRNHEQQRKRARRDR